MPKVRVILQARYNSSRLPGKMLLPLCGVPLLIVCAKRAMSEKYEFMVATSSESSDDCLSKLLDEHKIPCFRGPLDNVLERFIECTKDLDPDDIVVRLTGDNPFVDSEFIDLIVCQHCHDNAKYTRTLSPFDRLPYGVSAEVIKISALRYMQSQDLSSQDKEHVTSYLTNKGEYSLFTSPLAKDYSHLRASIDTKEDYERIKEVFDTLKNSLDASWTDLTNCLQSLDGAPKFRTPYRKNGIKAESIFALGTVQLGMPYGIANITGQPDRKEAEQILYHAINHGVNFIDTANAYGSAECLIGSLLSDDQKNRTNINTKVLISDDTLDAQKETREQVQQSLSNLNITSISCLLLHRWKDRHRKDGSIWEVLKDFKKEGKIQKLGASVQTPDEAISALQDPDVEFMQLPFNILDWRWNSSKFLEYRKKRKDVHVQARSALLQGLILMPAEKWPLQDISASKNIIEKLNRLVEVYKRKNVKDLCYAYVRGRPWIDSVVVGIEKLSQLEENLDLFNQPALEDIVNIYSDLPYLEESILDPAKWPRKETLQ